MDSLGSSNPPRPLTPQEVAACIRLFRGARHWSQEQLAEISGLSVRTIQRVEQGDAASFDTKRALARAFEMDDIDTLNKPFSGPTAEELKAARDKFDQEHVTVALSPLTSGCQSAKLAQCSELSLAEPGFELEAEAAQSFAQLADSFREYGDCSELYTEVQKLDVYNELQQLVDVLKAQGVQLRFAERQLYMKLGKGAAEDKPTPLTALYVMAFPIGKEPQHIAMPKATRMGW